jgi:hypothetical protein
LRRGNNVLAATKVAAVELSIAATHDFGYKLFCGGEKMFYVVAVELSIAATHCVAAIDH